MKIFDVNEFIENVKGYVQIQIELAKVEAQEQLQSLIKRLIIVLCWVLLGATILLFLLIGLALYLNQVFDSHFVGFFVVAGLALLISGVLGIVWKYLQPPTLPPLSDASEA